MTQTDATEHAKKLKEFCEKKKDCERCKFVVRLSICETDCLLNFPCNWNIKTTKENK